MNCRTFNINEVLGNFDRDWSGRIKNRDFILRKMHFRDLDGMIVNEKGYLIDPETGDIRSRYTFEVVFKNHLLGGRNKSELPLPYRMENHNFNPHQILGNFDYDEQGRPIILKDKFGNKIDKNLRQVNASGWLVDLSGNIIDNLGRIKFIKEQLTERGDLPKLFNFEGTEYKIRNIIG
jgi:hypothetical protein